VKRLALDGSRFPLEPERVDVLRADANAANGMTLGLDGRLLVCEQGGRSSRARISRLERGTGAISTVVDDWHGLQLNSPNDILVRTDGSIWFTDPSYGFLQDFRPEPEVGDFVYRFDPRASALTVVDDSSDKPNGLAFSPDETVLYIGDSGANQRPGSYHVSRPHHIVAFDVTSSRQLTGRRLFATITPGFPDGLKTDEAGRVYVSSFSGVQVLSPEGQPLGQIDIPGAVNFGFGGSDNNVLFITTDTAVWAAELDTKGA
jgi:gluconolactonase